MIQTLLKVLLFFAVVLAAALGATRLAETGQTLRLVFVSCHPVLSTEAQVALTLRLAERLVEQVRARRRAVVELPVEEQAVGIV